MYILQAEQFRERIHDRGVSESVGQRSTSGFNECRLDLTRERALTKPIAG
jgi:hypothetical protein